MSKMIPLNKIVVGEIYFFQGGDGHIETMGRVSNVAKRDSYGAMIYLDDFFAKGRNSFHSDGVLVHRRQVRNATKAELKEYEEAKIVHKLIA